MTGRIRRRGARDANERGALWLTGEKGFGEKDFRQRKVCAGVILIWLDGLSERRKAEIVVGAFRQLGRTLKHRFTVIEAGRI